MRDIKFRFYDNEQQEMIAHEDVLVIRNSVYLHENIVECERFKIMQYTGFENSKGNEVYEGDIVYVAGFGKAKAIITHAHGSEFEDASGHHRSMINSAAEGDIGEILGNIHQNPELLEQNDE